MITVIVPVYNVENYLVQCLDSITAQTERDLEILLIDDGSTDGSGAICDGYGESDSRVKVFHTENRGLSAARNLGMKEASGEYIGFVDSDDWIEPDMYEVMMRELNASGADICACSFFREYLDRTETQRNPGDMLLSRTEAVRAVVLGPVVNFAWNKLYRAEVLKDIRFPEGHVYEDVFTTYKAIFNAKMITYTSSPLYHYRLRDGSITREHSMSVLKDNWNAYYSKRAFLSGMPEFRDDAELSARLRESLASVAAKTWRWIWAIPRADRDYEHLKAISSYARSSIPFFGEKNWSLYLRMISPFLRYPRDLFFFLLHYAAEIYQFLFGNKGFQ